MLPRNWSPLSATPYSFVQILSSASKSSSLSTGQLSHSPILKLGLTSNVFINSALLNLYCRCHRFLDAQQLFDEMPQRNAVTWNTLIYGLSMSSDPALSFGTFKNMMISEVIIPVTPFAASSLLFAASRLADLRTGYMLHCITFIHGVCSNTVVGSSLVDMYSKCRDVSSSRRVFDEMEERNVITWTSLITGYAQAQRLGDAMLLFNEMRLHGVSMNRVTYNNILSSLAAFEDLVYGQQVHCLVIKEGLDFDPFVSVTLLTMYSRCGSSVDFAKLSPTVSIQDDQVAYNSVIAGYSHLGDGAKVIEMFVEMRKKSMEVDLFTFASVLRSTGIISALQEGRQIHALILKSGNTSFACVQNGLVSMYARCGLIKDSMKVFFAMNEPDLVSWNALMSGCAQHGYGREVVDLFDQMRRIGLRPNGTTFLAVFSACSHVGLVDKGLEYFNLMKEVECPVGMEHYACVVDLLGRAGHLEEAESVINSMHVKPDVPVYRALLSACQIHGDVKIAKRAAKCLLELVPNDPSAHVLLSNVLAAGDHWENASVVRRVMWGKGVRKQPACSLIDERIPIG